MKFAVESTNLACNTDTTLSRKRLHVLATFYKKIRADNKRDNETTPNCYVGRMKRFAVFSVKFDVSQILLFASISLCCAKWASSVYNNFCYTTTEVSCFIFVTVHLANDSFPVISASTIWCSDCNLYRYKCSKYPVKDESNR